MKKAPIRDEGSVTYSAALESAFALDTAAARSPFTERVWREATRRRFCQAPRTVVLGDGPLWIWNIADDQFPDATQIVDRFHAKRHLSDLEKLFPVPPPHRLFNGRNVGRKNSTPENSRRYSPPSVVRCTAPRTRVAVSTISRPTASVCAIRSSMRKACALPPAWWRLQGRHWHTAQTCRNAPGRSPL